MNTDPREIARAYEANGYYFPLRALPAQEALACRAELEALEARIGKAKLGNRGQLNYAHVLFTFADALMRRPEILDAVEAILGPDILVWGTTLFTKEPHSPTYISWHQDLRYWGLNGDAEVSAWIALGPVNEANGCMRFVPGSHRLDLVPHRDTFSQDNFLTRGQEAEVAIDEEKTVLVELEPGEASLHHGRLLHASGPNGSDGRRIGMVINYIAPHMRQVVAPEDFAVLVRGSDRHGHFHHVPPPQADLSEDALAWHRRILDAQNKAMCDGAATGPT